MSKRTSRIRSLAIAAVTAAVAILATVVTALADGGGVPFPK